jgi:hypothetical protein
MHSFTVLKLFQPVFQLIFKWLHWRVVCAFLLNLSLRLSLILTSYKAKKSSPLTPNTNGVSQTNPRSQVQPGNENIDTLSPTAKQMSRTAHQPFGTKVKKMNRKSQKVISCFLVYP